jgi:hypothetical protein
VTTPDEIMRARVQPGTHWAARDASSRRFTGMSPLARPEPEPEPVMRGLDHNDPAPLHEQLADILRERITSELPGRLPTEHELAALHKAKTVAGLPSISTTAQNAYETWLATSVTTFVMPWISYRGIVGSS